MSPFSLLHVWTISYKANFFSIKFFISIVDQRVEAFIHHCMRSSSLFILLIIKQWISDWLHHKSFVEYHPKICFKTLLGEIHYIFNVNCSRDLFMDLFGGVFTYFYFLLLIYCLFFPWRFKYEIMKDQKMGWMSALQSWMTDTIYIVELVPKQKAPILREKWTRIPEQTMSGKGLPVWFPDWERNWAP